MTNSCCPPSGQSETPQAPCREDCRHDARGPCAQIADESAHGCRSASPGGCPAPAVPDSCCPPDEQRERPGYRREPFVRGWLATPVGETPQVATELTARDRLGAWQMRWGIGRDRFAIAPGLYAVGRPDAASPVLVTANYKLSFDTLRRELHKIDAWILVLDTRGINVWCAAGKGTFGTGEIIRRVRQTGLERLVDHRRLIVPQLGAPGVAAHEVAAGCGFRVNYGPVRAADLPAFLHGGLQATPPMRRVTFSARERLVLAPVELVTMNRVTGWVLLVLVLLGGLGPSLYSLDDLWRRGLAAAAVYLGGLLAGAVLTPLLLPWIPGAALAWKGALVGLVTAGAGALFFAGPLGTADTAALLLALPAVASWCAMNFTGSTTYTSPSGVEKEMRRAIPLQALAVVAAGIAWFWGQFA